MIYYIDEIMGRGKTSAMINYIKAAPEQKRFLFITPLLGEDDRVCEACSEKGFVQPSAEKTGRKLDDIRTLLRDGRNIASTHALFSILDRECYKTIKENHYTLIIDETPGVIFPIGITPSDAADILDKHAVVDDDGVISWTDDSYSGRFEIYRSIIEGSEVIAYNKYHWVGVIPLSNLMCFEDVYIMTYLFQDQVARCYLDMCSIPYKRKYVNGNSQETYTISDHFEPAPVQDFRPLLHILDHKKMNAIGDDYYALSKSWYEKHTSSSSLKRLKNNTYNFFRNITKTSGRYNLWTTYRTLATKDGIQEAKWKDALQDPLYKAGFLSCNSKGTNQFRHKTSLAYLLNIFPNTALANYLSANGVPLDRDRYALSEMIQWIWRSAIRDGKEVTLYIPSRRMRTLLTDWMNEVCGGGEKI